MARILFIEDEAYEMQGVVKTLRRKHVLELRSDGASAMKEVRENHAQFDLILLDFMLPRGHADDPRDAIPSMPPERVGEVVFSKILEVNPDKPVIILTAARSDMAGLPAAKAAMLMQKPVVMAQLLFQIDQMLNKPARSTTSRSPAQTS